MANQKLSATVQIGSVLERSVKKNIGFIRSGLEGVGDEIKTIAGRQKELSKQRKVLEKEGRSVAELDREYEDLGRQLDTLKRKQERWTRAAQSSQRVGQDFRRMTGNITRVARNTAVAVGAVGTAIFGLASSTATLGDDVAKTADSLGVGVEAFQELRYAAERSGVPVEKFDSSMTAFVKRLGEAKEGTGPAADAIEALGLRVGDLLAMKPEDALGEIAARMQDVENPAERASIAADLFSRSGVGMVNMLRDGKTGLDELRQAARETGYVLSEDTTRSAEAFQDSLLDARLTVVGLKNIVGAELMPVVQRSMDQFADWAKGSRDEIEAFAEQTVASLERALPVVGQVASGLGEVAGTVGRVTAKVADMVGGWDNFGMILGGVMASKAIASVATFAFSVGRLGFAMWALVPALPIVAGGIKAIGLALLANPIGLAVTAIAGGAYLIIRNWEPIEAFFVDMWGYVQTKFEAAQAWVGATIDKFTNVENISAAWQAVQDKLGAVMDWLAEKFDWAMGKIQPVIDALKFVRDKAGSVFSNTGPGSAANPYPPGHPLHRPQKRARGGSFRPGGVLVGEKGPELRYESQAGYIAHNRATERIAALSAGARANIEGAAATMGAGSGGGSVVNNISINAGGMSPAALVDELERRLRTAASGSLYDDPRGYGQYGGIA